MESDKQRSRKAKRAIAKGYFTLDFLGNLFSNSDFSKSDFHFVPNVVPYFYIVSNLLYIVPNLFHIVSNLSDIVPNLVHIVPIYYLDYIVPFYFFETITSFHL